MTKDKKKEGQRQGIVKPQTPSEQLTNYKYRGVRGPCPTSASLVQGSCIRNMSPQNKHMALKVSRIYFQDTQRAEGNRNSTLNGCT